MARSMIRRTGIVLGMGVLLCRCSTLNDDSSGLVVFDVSVSADRYWTSSVDPCTLTVTVENSGNIRGLWGTGSSSCQLGAQVRLGHSDFPMVIDRVCSDDLAEQGLDAGAWRTERWIWDGRIFIGTSMKRLPAGIYRVFGAAGMWKSPESVEIEIR